MNEKNSTFYHGFWLEQEKGNNAFAYEARQNEGEDNPRLWVPSRKVGSVEDARIGERPVFNEENDEGKSEVFFGLEHFIDFTYTSSKGKKIPGVLFDNHNHACFFWHEARQQKLISDYAHLVHIDAHTDLNTPPSILPLEDSHDLEKVFLYTNYILNVGDFIVPSIETGCISPDITMMTTEYELLRKTPDHVSWGGSLIVDIDLDFWEKDLVDTSQVSIPLAKAWIEQADFLTLATSPFFVDQVRALSVARKLLS